MHVAVVNQFYSPVRCGGAEISVQHLCEALVERGNAITLLTSSLEGCPERELINGVTVRRLKCRNIYNWQNQKHPAPVRAIWHVLDAWNPLAFQQIRRVLREEQPDVLHTNNLAGMSSSVWGAAESLGIPVVHTLRDYYLLCPRSTLFRGEQNCIKQCASCKAFSSPKRLAARSVSGVVGISEFVLRKHQQAGLFARSLVSEVIPNPAPVPIRQDEQNSNGRGLTLGFLGRLEPAKGLEVLLKTLADHDFCGWSEVVVGGRGSEDYERDLRYRYSDARVKYLGHVDPQTFFQRVNLLVVPSLWNEPFGRVVIEAYASGIPVVVSNRGGLPELVADGETGFVFDPRAEKSLAHLLCRLSREHELLPRMGLVAKKRSKGFSSPKVAASYERVFRSIASR